MTNRMDLTAFRGDLTRVVDHLDETGPVRLTKYNDTVAEIRSATPEGDRRYTQAVLDTFKYLEELDTGLTFLLSQVGINTLADLAELAERHKKFADDGVAFSEYPEHALPEEGPVTVDEALAHLYFADDYPDGIGDPYAWFLACARLQTEAWKRGKKTQLAQPNAYDEDAPSFVELAARSGHTPDTLIEFGVAALDRDVPLNRLDEMLGSEPIPADVLALDSFSEWHFNQLKEYGLPHVETVAVFRRRLDGGEDAQLFTQAGIRTADEIEELIESKVSAGLAVRAHDDGLPPEEWKAQVPKVQHLKYKGSERRWGSKSGGVLSFQLLVEAAGQGLSLVRWDNNTLRVRADQTNKYFHAEPEQRKAMYPWCFVYDDRVVDMARAKISPSYITAFGKLMEHYFNDGTAPEGFADLAIQAYELGLTADMANAMSRSDAKQPKFTPAQLVAALEEGLSDPGTAHYLADQYSEPDQWILHLRERHERQLMTDTFVATVEHTEVWTAVQAAAQASQGLIKSRVWRGEIFMKGVIEKFLAGGPLNDYELQSLLSRVAWAFGDRSYLPKAWREQHEKHAEAVRQLARSFDELRRSTKEATT